MNTYLDLKLGDKFYIVSNYYNEFYLRKLSLKFVHGDFYYCHEIDTNSQIDFHTYELKDRPIFFNEYEAQFYIYQQRIQVCQDRIDEYEQNIEKYDSYIQNQKLIIQDIDGQYVKLKSEHPELFI